jgi:hypothetical protein
VLLLPSVALNNSQVEARFVRLSFAVHIRAIACAIDRRVFNLSVVSCIWVRIRLRWCLRLRDYLVEKRKEGNRRTNNGAQAYLFPSGSWSDSLPLKGEFGTSLKLNIETIPPKGGWKSVTLVTPQREANQLSQHLPMSRMRTATA